MFSWGCSPYNKVTLVMLILNTDLQWIHPDTGGTHPWGSSEGMSTFCRGWLEGCWGHSHNPRTVSCKKWGCHQNVQTSLCLPGSSWAPKTGLFSAPSNPIMDPKVPNLAWHWNNNNTNTILKKHHNLGIIPQKYLPTHLPCRGESVLRLRGPILRIPVS